MLGVTVCNLGGAISRVPRFNGWSLFYVFVVSEEHLHFPCQILQAGGYSDPQTFSEFSLATESQKLL